MFGEGGKYTLPTIMKILKSLTNTNNCSTVELSTDMKYDLCLLLTEISTPPP